MLGKLLIYGLVAGLCGGVLAAAFAALAGEPVIGAAVARESGHGQAAVPALVSREVQGSVGLLASAGLYGLALGGLFALVFAVVYGRVGTASPRSTAYGLAAAAFVVVFLVPFLKYPATPPGAAPADTIGERTALYATMLAISVLAAVAAARLRPALAPRLGDHGSLLAAGGVFLALVVGAGQSLPPAAAVPADYPAEILWQFREASVGTQTVMWLAIGLVFGVAAQRAMPRSLREG